MDTMASSRDDFERVWEEMIAFIRPPHNRTVEGFQALRDDGRSAAAAFGVIAFGTEEEIQTLTDAGADILAAFARHPRGETPLMIGCRFGNESSVRWLLSLVGTASLVNAINERGETPLQASVRGGNEKVTRLLLEHGADVGIGRFTALHHAAFFEDRVQVLDELLKFTPEAVDLAATNGITPLFCAIEFENVEGARMLLQYGANFNWTDADGRTALDYAVMSGNEAMVLLLLECHAKELRQKNNVHPHVWAHALGSISQNTDASSRDVLYSVLHELPDLFKKQDAA